MCDMDKMTSNKTLDDLLKLFGMYSFFEKEYDILITKYTRPNYWNETNYIIKITLHFVNSDVHQLTRDRDKIFNMLAMRGFDVILMMYGVQVRINKTKHKKIKCPLVLWDDIW